jgi:hypothetical protein
MKLLLSFLSETSTIFFKLILIDHHRHRHQNIKRRSIIINHVQRMMIQIITMIPDTRMFWFESNKKNDFFFFFM